jgi:hypothetical protein
MKRHDGMIPPVRQTWGARLMWGKMASCGRLVSDLCGFLSTARKAGYQSAARCHLAPHRLSGLAYTNAQIPAVLRLN